MQRPCPFCLRADRPLTREHVFARWLVQQVRGGRLLASSGTLASDGPRGEPAAPTPVRISRVVAAVCAVCNAGWMSALEVSFRRLIFARPRLGALQAPDRATLSRWATKTAVLLAQADGHELVGPLRREQLMSGMPDGIDVFLGRRRRPRQPLDFALDAADDDGADGVRSVTILVADLVASVARRGVLSSRHGTRLWPLRSHTLRWETLPVIAAAQPRSRG